MSDVKPEDYSCEVLLEKTTENDARNTSFPTDAYNVEYTVEGEDRLDVCRSAKMSNIFDSFKLLRILFNHKISLNKPCNR